jgi:Uma2 family endonuclease
LSTQRAHGQVSGTSQETDTRVKLPLYAAAGIPEVWIVDVNAETAEQYTEPAGDRYRLTKLHTFADTILCAELPQIAIPGRAILPWIAQ